MNIMLLCLVSHVCAIVFPLHVCVDLFSAVLKKVQEGVRAKELWKKAITKAAEANGNSSGCRTRFQEAEWEPDLCIQLLKIPAAHNYSAIRKIVEKAPRQWILQFLECDGLGVLLESLEKLGTRGFSSLADTFSQLQCVGCLRAVMNSESGLEFIIKRRDYTRQLANVDRRSPGFNIAVRILFSDRYTTTIGFRSFTSRQELPIFQHPRSLPWSDEKSKILFFLKFLLPRICNVLQSRDRVVKMHVFELLCALTMYSTKGHTLALDALNHFKICHGRRYRFDFIMEELRTADTPAYKTTLMAFINCLVFGYADIKQRTRLRNEFFGVGLGPEIDVLRTCDDKDLQIQIVAFENQQKSDEEKLEPLSHQDLFDKVFKKIANSPQALYFHAVLLNLSQIENCNADVDKMWELLEEITANAINPKKCGIGTSLNRKKFRRDIGTQTIGGGKRWHGVVRKSYNINSSKSNKICSIGNKYSSVGIQSDNNCRCFNNVHSSSVGIQVDSIKESYESMCNCVLPNLEVSSCESSDSIATSSALSTSTTGLSSVSSCMSLPLTDTNSLQRLENISSYDISSSYSETDLVLSNPHSINNSNLLRLPNNQDVSLVSTYLLSENNDIFSSSQSGAKESLDIFKVPQPPPLPDLLTASMIPLPPPLPTDSLMDIQKNSPSIPPPPPPPLPPPLSLNTLLMSHNKLIQESASQPPLPPPPPPLPLQFNGVNPEQNISENEISELRKLQQSSPPLPPPPPPDMMCSTSSSLNNNSNNNMKEHNIVQNICHLYNGRMTLPIKRNPLLNPDYTENKYHTLPNPNIKMKTLNWTKVSSKFVDRSLWSNTELPTLPVDYRKMEELFCQKPKEKCSTSINTLKMKPSSKSIVSTVNLLDNKRSLAVNIFLKQFKAGSEFVINAINTGSGLSVEKLKALRRLLPEKSELAAIKAHKNEDGPLGTAEKFYSQLSEIKNVELRVEAMLQKEECPMSINEISPLLDKTLEGCNFLIQDTSLKEFLKIVLHLGNYLNAGSYAGNAVGFKLNTLPKLLDTRANKPRMTFLHFVVEVAQNYDTNMLNFRKYLHQLRELSRTSITSIEEEVKNLCHSIKDIKKKLKAAGNQDVYNQFKDFLSSAEINITQLQSKIEKVKESSSQLAIHFCEDPSTFQLDECFSLFADFFEKLGSVILENEQRRKQEELSAKHSSDKKSKSTVKKKKSRLNDENDCVVDLLMKEIRGGTFKLRKTVRNHDKNL